MLPLNSNVSLGTVEYKTLGILHTRPDFTVFRVRNLDLERDEALRIGHSEASSEQQDRVRISQLSHPANIRLLSSGTIDLGGRRPVLFMALSDWASLEETLAEQTMPPLRACRLLGQLLGALSEAHEAGLVYGNLSPSTIAMVTQVTEQVRIMDYGIGAIPDESFSADPSHVFGNQPAYKAPEQLLGAPPSPRGDVFSLGVLMYELLSGHKPFAESGFALLRAYQRGTAPVPLEQHVEVPDALSEIIYKMIALDEDSRFQSADAIAARLLCLDPDELLAYSPVPLMERNALNMRIPAPGQPPRIAPAPEPSSEPEIWVLRDDPAFRQPATKSLIKQLQARYSVRILSPTERPQVYSSVVRGELATPWVVLFGDLHIILGEPLLRFLGQRGDLSRVLLSTHLNAELMHSTINACSLDQQIVVSSSTDEQLTTVEAMIERTRRIITRSSNAELQLRSAQDKIDTLKHQLSTQLNDATNTPTRRNIL